MEAVRSDVFEYPPRDRLASLHSLGERAGGYAPYALAPAVSFEAIATILLAAMTAAVAL